MLLQQKKTDCNIQLTTSLISIYAYLQNDHETAKFKWIFFLFQQSFIEFAYVGFDDYVVWTSNIYIDSIPKETL